MKQECSSSQKQAIIKFVEQKDVDKRFVENWRPISLLNVDTKSLLKTLAITLNQVFSTLYSSNETAYADL